MSGRATFAGPPDDPTPPVLDLDGPWTYKGIQVGSAMSFPALPDAAMLTTAQVGAVRYLMGEGQVNFSVVDTYLATLRNATPAIFPILGMDFEGNISAATHTQRVTDMLTATNAGIYELGNEEGDTFKYDGVTGTVDTWNRYLMAVEDAAAIIHKANRKCILGAALDVDTNRLLNAAKTRWGTRRDPFGGKPGWPVDGVAIHPYPHSSNAWNRTTALDKFISTLGGARTILTSPAGTPAAVDLHSLALWITEAGIGAGGNLNSTLVANENRVDTTAAGAQSLTGSTLLTTTNALSTVFPVPGDIFAINTAGQNVVMHYTGISGATFTGLTGGVGSIANNKNIARWVAPSNARENEQGLVIAGMFSRLWGGASPRYVQSDLNVKNIGIFWWHDLLPTPTSWWHFCGQVRTDHSQRATGSPGVGGPNLTSGAYTAFANEIRRKAY